MRTSRELRRRIPVVYGHFVGPPAPYYAAFWTGTTLARFDADLSALGRHFEFAPLDVVVEESHREPRRRPLLAVTFDDGFDMFSNGVADVLERHGVAATTFVITGTAGNTELMWRNKLAAILALSPPARVVASYNELARRTGGTEITRAPQVLLGSLGWPADRKDELADELWALCAMPSLPAFLDEHCPYFTWEALEEWIARGHGVGLHTRTHPDVSRLDPDAIDGEVVAPAAELRRRFGLSFLPFSYPFGTRLPIAAEQELFARGVFDCAFGIEGFAPRGAAPFRLERACIEGELDFTIFGKPFLGLPRLG